ncbi:MAG: Hsp20 family protein [Candidatus Phaeomarinobacter sp.]
MARVTPFTHPLLLGFDGLEQLLDRVGRLSNDGYPPFNIEQTSPDEGEDGGVHRFRITLAVAGFTRDELSVTVEGNELIIKGKQADDEDRAFLHRGIAARQFVRVFVLADGLDVETADLENGLLSIDLVKPEPSQTARRIEIGASVEDNRARDAKEVDAQEVPVPKKTAV